MGTQAENNLWYKEKSTVFQEYKKNTNLILATVGAKNFSSVPGFAIAAFTDVEIESKLKLNDFNLKIMSDAVDRELKQLGLEDDIALKQATMAWELEKLQLFSALQQEFADKELIRTLAGEDIDALMIGQSEREVAVLLSKIAIEIQIEDIKRQKEEAELLTLPYAEELAAAKLAAAIRKLDAIPYILAALEAQNTALDTESAVIMPARTTKANYEVQIANKTVSDVLPQMVLKAAGELSLSIKLQTLLPLLLSKASASKALADVMMEQLGNHLLIMQEKINLSNAKVLRLTDELYRAGMEVTLESEKIEIEIARAGLELQRANAKMAVIAELRVQLAQIRSAMTTESDAEITNINTTGVNQVRVKLAEIDIAAARLNLEKATIEAQKENIRAESVDDYLHQIAMATQASKAHISEKLIHLLG